MHVSCRLQMCEVKCHARRHETPTATLLAQIRLLQAVPRQGLVLANCKAWRGGCSSPPLPAPLPSPSSCAEEGTSGGREASSWNARCVYAQRLAVLPRAHTPPNTNAHLPTRIHKRTISKVGVSTHLIAHPVPSRSRGAAGAQRSKRRKRRQRVSIGAAFSSNTTTQAPALLSIERRRTAQKMSTHGWQETSSSSRQATSSW